MKEKSFVSFVVYAGRGTDPACVRLRQIDSYADERFENYEIVWVNDGLPDEIVRTIREEARESAGHVTVIGLNGYHGEEAGMLAGLDRAMGDFVFELQAASMGDPCELLTALWREAEDGVDIVSAASVRSGKEAAMRLVSRRALNAMLKNRRGTRQRTLAYRLTGYAERMLKDESLSDMPAAAKKRLRRYGDKISDRASYTPGYGFKLVFSMIFLLMALLAAEVAFHAGRLSLLWGIFAALCVGFSCLGLLLAILADHVHHLSGAMHDRPAYRIGTVESYRAADQITIGTGRQRA